MDQTAPKERTRSHPEELRAPRAWQEAQDALAAESGLAVLLVAGHQPPQVSASNNNSICRAFQTSPTHAHLCDPYCGEAFARARAAGEATHYRCHAGLHCFAMPVDLPQSPPLAVIGGRAFLSGADYRELVDRFRAGDLRELLTNDLFHNVLFSQSPKLDDLALRLAETASRLSAGAGKTSAAAAASDPSHADDAGGEGGANQAQGFQAGTSMKEACDKSLRSLGQRLNLSSLALMLRADEGLVPFCATGRFTSAAPRIPLSVLRGGSADTKGGSHAAAGAGGQQPLPRRGGAELFPLLIGEEIKGALLVGDLPLSPEARQAVENFCREIALPLEVMRLREELEHRRRTAHHLKAFAEQVNEVGPGDAYATILRHSTELLRSERGSLLLFDESVNELQVKAAVGPRAKAAQEARVRLGEGVAGTVLREGRPLVVRDLKAAGQRPAPSERRYKTASFISYPIIAGGRKVGVLNMTDKAGGAAFDEVDLKLLELIAPQMALALDRAEWHQKATQFQLLSITDPLTGLLNRRYLEERLAEELERSKRHRSPMSFLMIDIDNFKEYNDRHGHQAGDAALELTAHCLKAALRSADVAARYGGEEFSILLPQTSVHEARVIAERVRQRVEKSPYPHGAAQPFGAVTVSVGISAFGPGLDTMEAIVGAADNALYQAKKHGKNCVETYAPAAPPLPPEHAN